jgi:hypothetical protein
MKCKASPTLGKAGSRDVKDGLRTLFLPPTSCCQIKHSMMIEMFYIGPVHCNSLIWLLSTYSVVHSNQGNEYFKFISMHSNVTLQGAYSIRYHDSKSCCICLFLAIVLDRLPLCSTKIALGNSHLWGLKNYDLTKTKKTVSSSVALGASEKDSNWPCFVGRRWTLLMPILM